LIKWQATFNKLTTHMPLVFLLPQHRSRQPVGSTISLHAFMKLICGSAWVLAGTALRSGIAMGLHVRNEDSNMDVANRENLARIWWGNYCLELLVCAITGRPGIEMEGICSVPLPLPTSSEDIDESLIDTRFRGSRDAVILPKKAPKSHHMDSGSWEQTVHHYPASAYGPANSGSYLKHTVRLSQITRRALKLYAASTVNESWQSVQQTIATLLEELEAWAASLPHGLNFLRRNDSPGGVYAREQSILDILHKSTKILITRPCLCRLDRRIANQSKGSKDFNEKMASECVDTAKAVANLLPDDRNVCLVVLYQAGPWWEMVHVIMQSLLILLLEVTRTPSDFPEDRQDIRPYIVKMVDWLRIMRRKNGMAKRAYSIVLDLMRKVASSISIVSALVSSLLQSVSGASQHPTATPPPRLSHRYSPLPLQSSPTNKPRI
jgi:hypothetical protein